MKKIFGIVVAVSAFLASCSSPYYPEYVPVVSLGANTSALVCESVEGSSSLNVISNVEYTATIISGTEWLSFADAEGDVRVGNGNTVLVFNHLKNNHVKRVNNVRKVINNNCRVNRTVNTIYVVNFLFKLNLLLLSHTIRELTEQIVIL